MGARGRASRSAAIFTSPRHLTVVCAAQASTSMRSHTKTPTSATRAGPRPGGGTPPPRRRDARRGPSSLKSSHKKKTHTPSDDAAAPRGGSTVPAHTPQHTMDDRYLPRMGRGSTARGHRRDGRTTQRVEEVGMRTRAAAGGGSPRWRRADDSEGYCRRRPW